MKAKYIWIDLETTGLKPAGGSILEVAAVVTTKDLEPLFSITSWSVYISPKRFRAVANQWCQDMHMSNGLAEECFASTIDIVDVQSDIMAMINCGWEDEQPILAGSTPQFDRKWIDSYLPALRDILHYRHFDASTIHNAWVDAGLVFDFDKPVTHRAKKDIEFSLKVAQANLLRLRGLG